MLRLSILSIIMGAHFMLAAQIIDAGKGVAYLSEQNAAGYLGPGFDVISASFNSNWTFPMPRDSQVHFYLGIETSMAFIPESFKTYDGVATFNSGSTQNVEAPTVLGENEALFLEDDQGLAFAFPGGFAVKQAILGAPQIQIGRLLNTDFSLRFLPLPIDDDVGDFQLLGIGIHHYLDSYLSLENVSLSIGMNYQNIQTGDWLTANSYYGEARVSSSVGPLTYYGHVGYQFGNYVLKYNDEESGIKEVKVPVGSAFRVGIGAAIQFWKFNFHVGAMGIKPAVVHAGFGFNF